MARVKADQPLVPSVLDRLLDDEPGRRQEAQRNRSQVLRELKLSVRRDIENLLNTRVRCVSWPAELIELSRSLVNYGIPDVTGARIGSAKEREEYCRFIERAIREHERRFRTVHVRLLDNGESLDRTLRFRIDALLEADPAPEPVVFDSSVQPGTGVFEVKGVGDD
jgi:type VI secretion system protein ImpF